MPHRVKKKFYGSHDIRSEVTSVIAHQLKTPMAGIKSSLEVVLSGQLGEITNEQREYLQIALDETGRMIAMVKDLLDAARIDQKELKLKVQLTDLVKLVKDSIDNLSTFARATNTAVSLKVDGQIPLVKIDATKIQQVINNIIDNAIHYQRKKGDVRVRLSREGKKIIFSCQDNGIGVTKEESHNIFTKFYRGQRAVELVPMGSGLGLFIASAIIRQSGGKVWFTAAPEQGSIFYFFLPVK